MKLEEIEKTDLIDFNWFSSSLFSKTLSKRDKHLCGWNMAHVKEEQYIFLFKKS